MTTPLVTDELDLLASLVDLPSCHPIIELGCGAAALARSLVQRHPGCQVTALEVDARQHAKNLQRPQAGLEFLEAGAQAIPCASGQFGLALMLKSLHHVPLPLLETALAEVRRVLRPDGLLYVSEPVFAGDLNEVMRLFHDEQRVRAAALATIEQAVASRTWQLVTEYHFGVPVTVRDFAEFARRLIGVTYLDHQLDAATLAQVRARFEPHVTPTGAHFVRPMRVHLLRKL